MRRWLHRRGLALFLFGLFFVSWMGQLITEWFEFVNTQQDHGFEVERSAFAWEFAARTLENWQSEFLQLLTMVVATAYLIYEGSAESKDSDEEMLSRLARLEDKVNVLLSRATQRSSE